jgi:raffinose/stachyose/melibiose transport system substrate-binding protein
VVVPRYGAVVPVMRGVAKNPIGEPMRGVTAVYWELRSVLSSLLTVAVAVAVAVVVGCGDSRGEADKPAALTFWLSQQTPQAIKDEITAFGSRHGLRPEIVTIPDPFESNTLTKWTAGERPDVIYWQPATKFLAQLVPPTNLQDLSPMDFVKRTKYGLATESGAIGGKTYTATVGFPSVFGIIYNKAVFARHRLAPPKTLDELRAVSRKLKAAGVAPTSVAAGGDPWTTQVPVYEMLTDAVAGGLIGEISRGRAAWTDPAVVTALRDFKATSTRDTPTRTTGPPRTRISSPGCCPARSPWWRRGRG